MSDAGRKSTMDKAGETMKPDSQKSYTEMGKEKAGDMYEGAAKYMQPESEKSTSQKATDSVTSGSSGNAEGESKGMLDDASKFVGDKAQQVSDYMNSEKK